MLRWCNNPADRVAAFKVLQLIPGIGPRTADEIFGQAAGPRLGQELKRIVPPRMAAKDWPAFVKLMGLVRSADEWPLELNAVSQWLVPHIRRKYEDDFDNRAEDLTHLAGVASTFGSRDEFLRQLCIGPPKSSVCRRPTSQDDDVLILSTIHSAKGQRKGDDPECCDGCIRTKSGDKEPD